MGRMTPDCSQDGMLTRLLRLVTRSTARRPRRTLMLVFLSVLACGGLAAIGLKFKTSRSDLIDPQATFQRRWLKFTEKFGDQSDIVVVVESDEPARVRMALDALGERLQAEPELFSQVSWKFDTSDLRKKGLQYLSPKQLEEGLARLESYGPILAGHWQRAGLESYCRRLVIHARWARDQGRSVDEGQAIRQAIRLSDSLSRFAQLLAPSEQSPDAPAPVTLEPNAGRPRTGLTETSFMPSLAASTSGATDDVPHPSESASTLSDATTFLSPWPEVFPEAAAATKSLLQVRYHVTEDGRMGFLTSVAVGGDQDFSGTSPTLARLRELVESARREFPGVTFGLTGIPVLESDEMARSQADMTKASVVSFVGVAVILLIGFRGLRHPLLGLLMLLVGLAWAVGFTTLVVGHLNILSVSFAAILIGLGIDFAIHYLARYLELRHEDHELGQALEETSASVGTGLATAAITTAIAFLCAGFTRFLGVAELGIIAGGGIILCAAATFLVLVPLIRLSDQSVEPRRLPAPFQGAVLRWVTQRWPKSVAVLSGLFVGAVMMQAFGWQEGRPVVKVEYDSNLLNLQADDVDSVAVQQRVFQQTNGSLLYAVSLADSANECKRQAESFRRLESVAHVEHLGEIIPDYAPEETELLIQAIHARLANMSPLPRELPPIDPLAVGQALETLLKTLSESETSDAATALARLNAFLDRFEQLALEQQVELLNGYQTAMLTALRMQFEQIAEAADADPVNISDIASDLRSRFIGASGEWMLRVFPREQVWDEAPLEQFVSEVRTVDPEATGTPLQNYEAARQIRQSYMNAALYACLAVCLVLLIDALASGPLCVSLLTPLIVVAFGIVTLAGPDQTLDLRWMLCLYVALAILTASIFDFPNVRNMLLSMTPAAIGLGMMFGVLGFLGEHLNPANIIVLPLLLGIGVDDGVHVLHDFRTQQGGYRTSASTINAVVLTSLTSMAGFGSLLLASHRGLQSLGLVLVVGVGTCLFVSLVALPAVLTLIAGPAAARREENVSAELTAAESRLAVLPMERVADDASSPVGRNLRAAS